jgi:hypothetical protein
MSALLAEKIIQELQVGIQGLLSIYLLLIKQVDKFWEIQTWIL